MLVLVPSTNQKQNVTAQWLQHYFITAQRLTSPCEDNALRHKLTDADDRRYALKIHNT